ncbi:MAG: lipocalin family protein [Planctomycetes bacterium]|nr:lipocalin family protein [Planctomycetota bacterium]
MNQPAFLLFVTFSLSFTGCGSSTTSALSNSDRIIGTWVVEKTGDKVNPPNDRTILEFNKDGTGSTRSNETDRKREFTWKIEGDNLQFFSKEDGQKRDETRIKSISGDTMLLQDEQNETQLKKR